MSGSVIVLASILATFALAVAGLWAWALLKWDRKRPSVSKELASNPLSAHDVQYIEQVLPVSTDEAFGLVGASMKRLRGREIATVGTMTTGWVGRTWTNIPGHGEYQLIAVLSAAGDRETLVRCGARSRFPYGAGVTTGARRWTDRLVSEIASAAREDVTAKRR